MKKNQSDPVIDEIREIRHRISARFDHDPERLGRLAVHLGVRIDRESQVAPLELHAIGPHRVR